MMSNNTTVILFSLVVNEFAILNLKTVHYIEIYVVLRSVILMITDDTCPGALL